MAWERRQRDGSRRRATHLPAEGLSGGRAQARRVMTAAGVSVRRPRARGPGTTERRQDEGGADHGRARQGAVAKPEHAWAGDSTDRWTAEGWVYLSGRLEVYARTGVGWALRRPLETAVVPPA